MAHISWGLFSDAARRFDMGRPLGPEDLETWLDEARWGRRPALLADAAVPPLRAA
jgi:hypothetical protein